MLKWDTIRPSQEHYSVLRPEQARFSVTDRGDEQWQHFSMDFGEFSKASHDSCCVTWPAEAIALARAALDELEAKLNEPEHTGREKPTNAVEVATESA